MGTTITKSTLSMAAALLCAGLTCPALADDLPDEIVSIQPSSEWNIDFGEENCRLARRFGEGEDSHLVFFEQSGPNTDFGMTIAGPRLERFDQIITRLAMRPKDGFPQVFPKPGEVVGFGKAAIFARISISDEGDEIAGEATDLRTLPAIDLEKAGTIERVIYGHGGYAIAFETGDLAPAFQALNTCAADFVRAWGLDPERHAEFKSMAKWTNEKKISRRIQKEYTRAALNRGQQAILRMRVIVEADGSVSDCTIYNATDPGRIETNGCKAMEKAEFDPALDKEGQPMRSFYTTNIIYQIIPANAHG